MPIPNALFTDPLDMNLSKCLFLSLSCAVSCLPACNSVPVRRPFAEAETLACPKQTQRIEEKDSSYPKFYCVGLEGREGPYLEFDAHGNIKTKSQYHKDQLNGEWTSYHPDGAVDVTGNIQNGIRNGLWTQKYVNGNLRSEKHYKNDTLDGMVKLYYQTGVLMAQGNYRDGFEEGPWQVFTPEGKLARECVMVHGKETDCKIHVKDFNVESRSYNSGELGPL